MMTRNLRAYTLKAMGDDDTRGKIDDGQVQSVFHLREIDAVSGEPLTYLVYGVKDVHHLSNGTEVTDHFVNEYRVRLIADKRSDVNPDGLWIADYSERPIDGERRDRILNAPDATLDSEPLQTREVNDGSRTREGCRRCSRSPSIRSRGEAKVAPADGRSRPILPCQGGIVGEKPELGVEVPSEGEALIKAFQSKNGVIYTLLAYKAEAEMQEGSPTLVKRPIRK
jgi:hypothetical protein